MLRVFLEDIDGEKALLAFYTWDHVLFRWIDNGKRWVDLGDGVAVYWYNAGPPQKEAANDRLRMVPKV